MSLFLLPVYFAMMRVLLFNVSESSNGTNLFIIYAEAFERIKWWSILFYILWPSTNIYLSFIGFVLWQGYQSLQVYRVAHALWGQGRKVLALVLQSRVSEVVFALGKKMEKTP